MKLLRSLRALSAVLLMVIGLTPAASAAVEDLLFTVAIDGQTNTPTFTVTNNSPTLEITEFRFTIGNTAFEFDSRSFTLDGPPGGTATLTAPGVNAQADEFRVRLTSFGPGETFTIRIDIDEDGRDENVSVRNVFYDNDKNGNPVPNSKATVYAGPASASRTLPDNPLVPTIFRGPGRKLVISSRGEEANEYVRGLVMKHEGVVVAEDFDTVTLEVAHGDRIQIVAPQEVYKDIHSDYMDATATTSPDELKSMAEEKYVALGMTVNNVAQTADPTNYDFKITQDTEVLVKWEHYYALTIRQDFSKTQSQEVIAGKPWAGPLGSDAAGNPNPAVSKHWFLRGSQPVVQIDGQSLDTFSHPGLDVRHVVKGYRAYGPPNNSVPKTKFDDRLGDRDVRFAEQGTIRSYSVVESVVTIENGTASAAAAHRLQAGDSIEISGCSEAAFNGVHQIQLSGPNAFTIVKPAGATVLDPVAKGIWRNITYITDFPFANVEQRQQIKPPFTMYGPGGITFYWQIQYGVRVSADDITRLPLARVYEVIDGGNYDRTVPDGVSWFDPGSHVKVVAAAKEAGNDPLSLTGWVNGDGFYFSGQGQIDPSDGSLVNVPVPTASGSPIADWSPDSLPGARGYEIPNLQRPVRTLWRYGAGAIVVHVTIGKHAFEDYPQYASMFTRKPEPITNAVPHPTAIVPGDPAPGADLMAEWDPVSARLFPTIPGRFTIPWKPGVDAQNAMEVRVVAELPVDTDRHISGHYPHIQGSPPVALDPDPADDFAFKSVKYSTAGATVDAAGRFTTGRAGFSVLLFSQLQSVGRGQPRQFLKVRVVDTRLWDTRLLKPTMTVPVGSKIVDPDLDLARLGTGHLLDLEGRARYNPFIYDSAKLQGLAARNVYDMDRLRADESSLAVVGKSALPGPIIPVNEAPGASERELPIVVWYDDPRRNDEIMWPYAARVYRPQWPDTTNGSVPQIIIASQYGSEGKSPINKDQVTAPAIGAFPSAATTYDPSRLQAVQIYQQPNPNAPGYNPNEEHALLAPSLRFASVSPRPSAVYALRAGDLNSSNRNRPASYTSHPFVLVQFHDEADDEMKMNLYTVRKESATGDTPAYRFAGNLANPTTTTLKTLPFVKMRAGEPVIPFYPLGVAIGASPSPQTFGNNFFSQEVYWEDWRGSYWSISGGDNAWFEVSFHYPLAPDFWWPDGLEVPPVTVIKNGAKFTAVYDTTGRPSVPGTGDSVAFLPLNVRNPADAQNLTYHTPTRVIYKSEWPENPPVLKAGETLTFSGGEYRADHPTQTLVTNGVSTTAATPGLPQLVAFASAEVVYDSLNSEKKADLHKTRWTARVVPALEKRTAKLLTSDFPSALQPASGRTTVKQGKYIFNELPASLQRRVLYNPLDGVLELTGLLNDKGIGEPTLTAAPPAVYVLEPNILTGAERDAILALVDGGNAAFSAWSGAVNQLFVTSRDPEHLGTGSVTASEYLAGLMKEPRYNADGSIAKDALGEIIYPPETKLAPLRAFGPGLSLVPNAAFLDPDGTLGNNEKFPDESWVTVVENNDSSLGGSPITPHIIKVDRRERYRGSVKTILSDNVFDENIVLRSTGDFGANAEDLNFEWWYRPDDGSLDVPPPDLIPAGQTNPWKLFPDPSGKAGSGRYQITLKGNPNAPEALLADTLWFMRYRHKNDVASGTNWKGLQSDGRSGVNFTWAGAGNSQPFVDANQDGFPDYRPQLAQGWIKRVLDAVNPYEARIRDFDGDNPATQSSMLAQFGPRYEGPVALNPAKNAVENVGLIELYETVLNRGRNLSVDLSQPVSTPAISNALQLASTRISDFYTLLGNEAYGDSLDPTIGHGSDSVDYGSLSSSVFTFGNQMSSLMEEELALLRGVDDYFARPVYNRLFWNFTKGEGEAAYATNYNVSDVNADGFIDEHDAMLAYPQGHGDAWGHYLTALRNQYNLLRHPSFNWVSRAESYNLMDVVITVDFLDERKFAATAAAKAKTGAEIVALTYRDRYVADPKAQWQGYTDSNADRAWGVDEWSRRAGQSAYFDWVTSNALLPSEHPNKTLEGIRKVDRKSNGDIAVISANLGAIQRTMDQADHGYNPLGLARGAQMFDLDPMFEYFGEYGAGTLGKLHFDQIYERMSSVLDSAHTIWDAANERSQMVRKIGTSEAEFRNSTFQEDLSYRNRLIQIFGKPYAGTIGSGKLYPAGYEGPDLGLYMYVPVRQINRDTVPQPSESFAILSQPTKDAKGDPVPGTLTGGDLYKALVGNPENSNAPDGSGSSINGHETALNDVSSDIRLLFNPTFAQNANTSVYESLTTSGWFNVNYTDLVSPKVGLVNFSGNMPVTAAGYTFQAPPAWGARGATGELQTTINQMIQQEAEIAKAIGAWDALTGETVRILRLINAKLTTSGRSQGRNEVFSRVKLAVNDTIKVLETARGIVKAGEELVIDVANSAKDSIPTNLPTAGLSFSPGDALSAARGGIQFAKTGTRAALLSVDGALAIGKLVAEISLDIADNELTLANADESRKLDIKEWLKELEDKVGDEPVLRIAIFKEMQALREMSDHYRTLLDEGGRLVDERSAFNKRVAAQTQLNRYQDMTFRVSRNHALQTYRSSFDLAARYAYLAVSAYDYETNYALADPASPVDTFGEVIRSRSLAALDTTMSRLKQNYDSQRGALGMNNPQRETGEISMRGELLRILPHEEADPENPPPDPSDDSNTAWKRQLQAARVVDLWQVPEFRNQCRPFAAAADATGKPVPQPGIVLRFSSDISSGKNFFGKPLSGGDQAYSTSNFATKIVGVGVAFSGYRTDDVAHDLAAAPRIYFVPAGIDIMRVSRTDDPDELRMWKVAEQAIPVPFPATQAAIQKSGYIPLLDGLNGRFADQRRFSDFRAYPDELGDAVKDTRLVGRSIWNTQWVLIIPGATLNADPATGLDRFVEQVTDIKLIFDTYGQSGG